MTKSKATDEVPKDERRWGRALVWFVLGLIAFVVGAVVIVNADNGNPWIFWALSGFWWFLGVRNLKKRTYLVSLSSLGDSREPVLFLRSFAQDGKVSSGAKVMKLGSLVPKRFLLSLWSYLCLRWSFEQVLAHAACKAGPLIAVGPRGAPPVLGAHNFYLQDSVWQQGVRDLATKCQLVVIRAGLSPGLLEEVREVVTYLAPQRLLLFFPDGEKRWWWPLWRKGSRKKLYARFRELAAPGFPMGLPEKLNGATSIGFDADWQPILIESRRCAPNSSSRDYVAYMVGAIT